MRCLLATACAAIALAACDSRLEPPLGVAIAATGADSTGAGLSLLPGSIELRIGGSAQLVTNGSNALLPVTYNTDAPGVASVSASGLVTGIAPGVAIITATSTRDPSRRTTAVVRVIGL